MQVSGRELCLKDESPRVASHLRGGEGVPGLAGSSTDRCLSHLAPLGRTGRQQYIGEFLKQKTTISAKWT